MKNNKGISLIVLIITIVVIIILATAIIVNIAKTNIIDNANEAVVKQDFKTFQDELTLYTADKFVQTKGKFETEKLNADSTSVTYTGEGTLTESNVYDILTSLEKSKYKEYVIIKDGKIAILDTMPEKEKKWAKQAIGEIEVVEGPGEDEPQEPGAETPEQKNDETAPTVPTNLELTVKGNEITALASGSTDENEITYEYSLDKTTWEETGVFEDLENKTKYTVYARAKDEAGNISEVIEKEETTKYSTSDVNTKVETRNATITGENPTYNNPVIPVGFKASDKGASWEIENGIVKGWNDGVVIVDEKENEFVWVPVDGKDVTYINRFNEYRKIANVTSVTEDTAAIPVSDEETQIVKYGGFYIGRYEAGVPQNQTAIDGTFGDEEISKSDVEGIPVVQRGATVWTNIGYENANKNALAFYNKKNVKSGLVTGMQWDTVMKWISSEKDPNVNCASWGNYLDTTDAAQYDTDKTTKISGVKQTAGKSEYWKAKNIYDLAGNAWEWTGEINATDQRVCRSGQYGANGEARPAAYRGYSPIDSSNDAISFRVVLYII